LEEKFHREEGIGGKAGYRKKQSPNLKERGDCLKK